MKCQGSSILRKGNFVDPTETIEGVNHKIILTCKLEDGQ